MTEEYKEKIFNEILKVYPSCHDLLSKRILTDKILNLPVDGVQVTFTCPECDGKKEYIHNGFTDDFDSNGQPIIDEKLKGKLVSCDCMYGKMVRPITIGEALEMLNGLFNVAKKVCSVGCMRGTCKGCWVKKALTTKDGGIVEAKND